MASCTTASIRRPRSTGRAFASAASACGWSGVYGIAPRRCRGSASSRSPSPTSTCSAEARRSCAPPTAPWSAARTHARMAMPAAGEARFYYDVVCPYSYLESHWVEQAEDDGRATVQWLPFELRPAPRPLLDPRGDHLRMDWTQNVYRRALGLGIEIHLPRYQPRSTLILAACLWAQEAGRLRPFRRTLYEAFFCEG